MSVFKAVRMMLPSGKIIIAKTKEMFNNLTNRGAKKIKVLEKEKSNKPINKNEIAREKAKDADREAFGSKKNPLDNIDPDNPDRKTTLGKRGYNVQVMKDGGLAKKTKSKKSRGSGAAIKGTKFKGVF